MPKRYLALIFLILALILAYTSRLFDDRTAPAEGRPLTPEEGMEKMHEVMRYIQAYYVDDVDWNRSVTGAVEGLLETLDPHSVYFTPEEVRENEESFQGRYYGIGIHYDVIDGFITVLSVISGSPSEKAGVMAGDRITRINGESAEGISNADVQRKLKGPRSSKVQITVHRAGVEEEMEFTLVRDEIPISTLNTYFMADEQTGYIWLSRFATRTADELETALIELERQGMRRLLLDLRGNTGGYLRQAVEVVGKFIHGSKLVVYTKGKRDDVTEKYYTDQYGRSIKRDFPLIILINNNSASASEIVAGAIQDYDRGLIVGTNSFGKGLVQNEFVLNDESRIRITVSKYYTPSGRLIQRPYTGKNREEYYYEPDSMFLDTLIERPEYTTQAGRTVYGGGGIQPDSTIGEERIAVHPSIMYQLIQRGVLVDVASWYVHQFPEAVKDFTVFDKTFTYTASLRDRLYQLAVEKEVSLQRSQLQDDRRFLENRLKAEIARSVWDLKRYWQIILEDDKQFKEALALFPEAVRIGLLGAGSRPKK